MKRYEVNTPRAALALVAAALTALTIGIAVVWPAHADADPARTGAATLAAARSSSPAAAKIALDAPHVDRIDVVAVRGARMSVHAIYLR
ncbi:MAG TPA: hypothetical protein VLU54_04780, partial [Casimicrobiaceae bacterium]|nr:hypothetical protein [Casimicrobiaceae bacterium]